MGQGQRRVIGIQLPQFTQGGIALAGAFIAQCRHFFQLYARFQHGRKRRQRGAQIHKPGPGGDIRRREGGQLSALDQSFAITGQADLRLAHQRMHQRFISGAGMPQ